MIIDKKYKNCKGIYKLIIQNHIYIGSSINIYRRLIKHYRDLLKNDHHNLFLQRCVRKYGLKNLHYTIIEINNLWTKNELLEKEKYYIEYFKADLNLKSDPTTQRNCKTTSKVVYQFDLFGNFIRKWPSVNEAARHYQINNSNITVCCLYPKRQRKAGGYLWSYTNPYPFDVEIIYVFNKYGNF